MTGEPTPSRLASLALGTATSIPSTTSRNRN
nr:hypothetical protein [Rhodococcus opacus]